MSTTAGFICIIEIASIEKKEPCGFHDPDFVLVDDVWVYGGKLQGLRIKDLKQATQHYYDEMARYWNDQTKNGNIPQTLAILWVPNKPINARYEVDELGTAYVASGIRGQSVDANSRRPTTGFNRRLHPVLERAVGAAVGLAVEEENKFKGPGYKTDNSRGLGHRTGFACAEMHALNWFLWDLDVDVNLDPTTLTEGQKAYRRLEFWTFGRREMDTRITANPMPPCAEVTKNEETRARYDPEISYAGCHHFLKVFGITHDGYSPLLDTSKAAPTRGWF